jgi:hypothetical protein
MCSTVATTPHTIVNAQPRAETNPRIGTARAVHSLETEEDEDEKEVVITLTAVPEPRLYDGRRDIRDM